MPKGPVSNFTTTSLTGSGPDSGDAGEIPATRFGNFEVLTNDEGGLYLLGGGGFGKTYKARHVYLNQIVALKVINDRFLHDNAAKERFLREAQVVHQLRHPHIAHVLDFGEVKRSLYYAMEFCGGGNLEHMVSRVGPLPLPLVLRCARQLTEALGCAHSHGFIHRDVKPANVMLTGTDDNDPQLKLVDFGLVKHLQGNSSEATAALTMTGQQFFTIQFASPEQLMEEELDARSDIFALGMTVWFLIKGSAPEVGSMASIVAKRLDSRSYESQLPAELPPAYRAVLARLLEKDRTLRFQNTDEVLAALDAAATAPETVSEPAAAETMVAGPAEVAPEPVAVAEPEAEPGGPPSIMARYTVLENLGVMPLGVLYRAASKRDEKQVAITMIGDALREDPTQRGVIERNVALLQAQPHETIAAIYALEDYQEGLALIQEWHRGVSLHSILKSARFLNYSDALRVLLPIAQGTDWTSEQGLPGVVLAMDEIYLQPIDAEAFPDPEKLLETPLKSWPPFRVRLLPYVMREDSVEDVGRTINTEMVSDPTVAFSCLLYHLVAGHAPRAAAKLSKVAYVTIGRFAEDSNRLLASCIANEQDFGGCEGILRALNENEGIGFPPPQPQKPPTAEFRSGAAAGVRGTPPTTGPLTSRTPTSSPLTVAKPGGAAVRTPATGSLRSGLSGEQVVEARRGSPPTSGGGGGLLVGRSPEDVAREAEEARVLKEAQEIQRRRQAAEEEHARREAEEARQQAEELQQRQQQAEEERARRAAEEAAVRARQAEEARAKRAAEEAQLRARQAEEARVRKLQEEERARQEAEEKRLRKQQADEERARKEAEEKQLKQRLAEEARLKRLAAEERARQEAEEKRLRKQQLDEERARKDAEEKRLKQAQVEEARLRKQQLDEERARKEAEERQLKQRQADEARARKLAEEERARQEVEEKRRQQQLADEERARKAAEGKRARQPLEVSGPVGKLELHTLKPATHPPEAEPLTHEQAQPVIDDEGRAARRGGALLWVGVAACCGIVALAAFFLLRGKPSVPTQPKDEPVAVANPTATPAAPAETAAPMPSEFVFAEGFLPPTAVVKVNDQVVNTRKDGSRVVVPLTGIGTSASLNLEARGYETEFFPISRTSATVDQRVELRRKQGAVVVQLRGNATDYATAELRPLKALPGEEAYVQMDKDNRSVDLTSGAKANVPTGIYQVTLAGDGDASGAHIEPRVVDPRFSVSGDRQNVLAVPPSFRGRYTFEFTFQQDAAHQPIKVRRTLVIDPSLTSGHVDDIYFTEKPSEAKDTLITDLVLNSQGVLKGRIRFSLRKFDNMGYDEQFELSFTDNHFVMISGGWEVPPTDPVVAREIAAHLEKGYQIHTSRPAAQTVVKE